MLNLRPIVYSFFVLWLAAFVLADLCTGQSPPPVEWERTYGGQSWDYGVSVDEVVGGGYLVAGGTASFGDDISGNVYLARLDASGKMIWERAYGEGGAVAMHVEETSQGEFIVVGMTGLNQSAGQMLSLYLLKTDINGEPIWEKTFPSFGWGSYVEEVAEGGYVVTGNGGDIIHAQAYILRTDEDGVPLWDSRIDGFGGTGVGTIHQTMDGGFILSGMTALDGPGAIGEPYIAHTDIAGYVLWEKKFGIGSVASAQETEDGKFVLSALRYIEEPVPGSPGAYSLLVQLNLEGEEEWRTEMAAPETSTQALDITPDGRFVVLGTSYAFPSSRRESHLIKSDRLGCLWNLRFAGTDSYSGGFARVTRDGGYIVVGSANNDVYVAKLGPEDPDNGFVRGNADGNGSEDLTDGVFVLNYLFQGGPRPASLDAADSNDDGTVDLTDAVYFLNYLFLGGPPPLSPHPQAGSDPTHDQLGCQG